MLSPEALFPEQYLPGRSHQHCSLPHQHSQPGQPGLDKLCCFTQFEAITATLLLCSHTTQVCIPNWPKLLNGSEREVFCFSL